MERKTLDQLKYDKALADKEAPPITRVEHICDACGKMIPAGSPVRTEYYPNENLRWYGHFPNCNNPEIKEAPEEEQGDLFEK